MRIKRRASQAISWAVFISRVFSQTAEHEHEHTKKIIYSDDAIVQKTRDSCCFFFGLWPNALWSHWKVSQYICVMEFQDTKYIQSLSAYREAIDIQGQLRLSCYLQWKIVTPHTMNILKGGLNPKFTELDISNLRKIYIYIHSCKAPPDY